MAACEETKSNDVVSLKELHTTDIDFGVETFDQILSVLKSTFQCLSQTHIQNGLVLSGAVLANKKKLLLICFLLLLFHNH